jgi:hypothetical protein
MPDHLLFLQILNMNETTTILLSTAYLPPIEYFIRIMKAGSIVIEYGENYVKQTYRNRCEIYTANGKTALTIPVIKTNGNHTKTKDIKIDYSEKWQLKHWRAIVSAYNKSPYFLYYKEVFEPFFFHQFIYLFDFNTQLLEAILKVLSKKSTIKFTNSYLTTSEKSLYDLRNTICPKKISEIRLIPYTQVFIEKYGFLANLSFIDLLFNIGPDSTGYLNKA